ncbi:MAG: uroporphyrinogen-III synthase [Bacteroidota bacterium]|nr:uroporphyrinogen-III synthase [Bacteroidota bacterium]MDP4211583.1 uroporphyrinogen-III synthase [Bacteroidota bacterium]MDP4249110.1 uroporphyrinogen-III synthase [Bacteroidota bacterium]
MPDRPFTILSTGSASADENRTAEKGNYPLSVVVEEIPFIQITLNSDEHTRNEVMSFAGQTQVVVFTSANAVKAVSAFIHRRPDWGIYAVGSVTRKQIVSFFGEAAILSTAKNAEELSGKIIQDQVRRAVFFCGDQRRDVLPDKLNEHGIHLQELVVYRTCATPVQLEKDFDAILFFSPTAVTSFFSINSIPRRTVLFALGETTAQILRSFSNNELLICPNPDKKSLLKMAIDYGRSHPISSTC